MVQTTGSELGSLPPEISQPNIFPLSWSADSTQAAKLEQIWAASRREYWDPQALAWSSFDAGSYTAEQREAIAYWWALLSVFDASAPPVFAEALIRTYEVHEEDAVRRCFFSIERDEQNHEQMCGMAISHLTPGGPLGYEPTTELGKQAQRNVKWLYHNGARYWDGYKKAVGRYSLPVLFSSFLMGETAAATLFHHMASHSKEPLFADAFTKIGRDEGRHMAICLTLMERDYPHLSEDERKIVTKQIRAGYVFLSGVLFEPPQEFWDLPEDFIATQRACEEVARSAGFGVATFDEKKDNWRKAMLDVKGVVERHNIAFPAIPEVGITGEEVTNVDYEDIIPVF
ncbi:MAG: ferritin-like domain-containing protein [Actinobacteria bacterium]|nr:ferritin-like domain-containing protein [Actinomycetota bacterium]